MTTAFQSDAFQSDAFQIDSAPTPTPGRSGLGGDDVPRRITRNPNPGWSRAEWKARVKDGADSVEATLRDTYDRLTGKEAPVSVLARVDAIVRPVARKYDGAPLRINWQQMARDYTRANALMRLYREEQELRALDEDDEEILMLVMQ